jgi:hypothetical protein
MTSAQCWFIAILLAGCIAVGIYFGREEQGGTDD